MSYLVERAKQMPSSLNDACRTIELMAEEIERISLDREQQRYENVKLTDELSAARKQLASARMALRDAQNYLRSAAPNSSAHVLAKITRALTDETGK